MIVTSYTYVFYIPGSTLVKIGTTARPSKRLYQLQWGEAPAYAPADRSRGRYACLIGFADAALARVCERKCQTKLRDHEVSRSKPSPHHPAGGRPEWFEIHPKKAVTLLISISKKVAAREKVIMNSLDMPLWGLT